MVCGYVTDRYLEVLCPACDSKQRIEADGDLNFTCKKCQHSESRHDLLDECNSSPEDVMIMGGIASCSDCGGYETICDFGDSYLCVNCLVLHDTVGQCEYCGSNSTDISDMSSLYGCSFCSGNVNALYDDD